MPFAQYVRQDPRGPEALAAELHRLRGVVERLARASHIGVVRVFGSLAHGSENAGSDIDLLVEPSDDASLFDLAQFELDMEALFGRPVDVVSVRGLDPERDAVTLADARPL